LQKQHITVNYEKDTHIMDEEQRILLNRITKNKKSDKFRIMKNNNNNTMNNQKQQI